VEIAATATVLKTDPQRNTGIQKNMWDVGERTYHLKNYLPQVLLISDEFEIPQLNRTRKYGRYFLTIMMIQRKDTL
jgi:hypothetical protein